MKQVIKLSKHASKTIASMQVGNRRIYIKGDDAGHARRRIFMATRSIRQAGAY